MFEVKSRKKNSGTLYACSSCFIGFESSENEAIQQHIDSKQHKLSLTNILLPERSKLSESVRSLISREVLVEVPGAGCCICLACKSRMKRDLVKIKRHIGSTNHSQNLSKYKPFRKLTENDFHVDEQTMAEKCLIKLSCPYLKTDVVDRSQRSMTVECSICQTVFKAFLYREQDIIRHVSGKNHREYVNYHSQNRHIEVHTVQQKCKTAPMVQLLKKLKCSEHVDIKESSNKDFFYYYCKLCDRSECNDTQIKKHVGRPMHHKRIPNEKGFSKDQYCFDFTKVLIASKYFKITISNL